MAAFSVATGMTLLWDEGVLPPNPAREAIAFTSPAEDTKLGSDGFALRKTATALAMEDESANGTVELSTAAIQFLAQDLAAPDTKSAKPQAAEVAPQPYDSYGSLNLNTASTSGEAHSSSRLAKLCRMPNSSASRVLAAASRRQSPTNSVRFDIGNEGTSRRTA